MLISRISAGLRRRRAALGLFLLPTVASLAGSHGSWAGVSHGVLHGAGHGAEHGAAHDVHEVGPNDARHEATGPAFRKAGHGHAHDPDPPGIVSHDPERRTLVLEAVAQPGAFEASLPPDHQYHALVFREGSAAGKSLFVTPAADTTVARLLREMGAEDGGGVPMAAWNLRWVPLVPQPSARVQGTPVRVTVHWETESGQEVALAMGDLLRDPGARGTSFRFGGNESQNHRWDSGCILCLFSCPGGVISNAAYTIRDHQRGATHFLPGDRMPPDGTPVRISLTLELEPDSG